MSVESGELRLNVVADTSGLAADLKAKLAKVRQDVKVGVKVNATELRAEVKAAGKNLKVKVTPEVSSSELRAALAAATRNVTVKVTPKVDAAALRGALSAATKNVTVTVTPKVKVGELRAALQAATRDVKISARVEFDRAQVKAAFAAATVGLKTKAVVEVDKNRLFRDVRSSLVRAMSNLPPIPGTGGNGGGGGSSRRSRADSEGALGNTIRSSLAGALDQVQKIEIDADTGDAEVSLQRLRARIESLSGKKLGVDVTTAEATRQIEVLQTRLARLAAESPDVRVRVDAAAAEAKLAAVKTQIEALDKSGASSGELKISRGLKTLGRYATIAVAALSLFEGAGASILGVVGALAAAVNGLFAMIAASRAAAGALVAIPAGLSLVASVAATAIAGFKGVGEAVKGLQDKQSAAGKNAQSLAKAQRSAAETIASAQKRLASAYEGVESAARNVEQSQRSLRDAYEGVDDAQRSARDAGDRLTDSQKELVTAQRNVGVVARDQAEAVAAAEDKVRSAQDARRNAQERLTDAVKSAQQQLQDYDAQLKGAALDEEGAVLAVERARERLNEVNTDPSSKVLDRKEADLAYRESLQRLSDLQTSNKRLASDAAEAASKGVKGSDAVVAASKDAADASKAVVDAQQDQIKSVHDRSQAEQDAADAVVGAQKDVRDAFEGVDSASRGLRDAYEGVKDAQYNLVQSQQDQVKAAQEVVDAQQGVRDAQRDAAEAIRDSASATNEAEKAFLNASPAAQNFAKFLVNEFIPVLKRVQTAVQQTLLPDLETALRNLLPLERPVTGALQTMAGAFGDFAIGFSKLVTSPAWVKDIQEGGKNNARTFSRLADSLLDILDVFRNVTSAAQPLIDRFTEFFGVVTEGWKDAAQVGRDDGGIEAYFKRVGDVIAQWSRIVDNVFAGIGNIAKAAEPAGQALLDAFEGSTKDFADYTKENMGKITEYFNTIEPVVRTVGRIFVGITRELIKISENPATRRIIDLIETRLGPALDDLITALLDSGSGELFVDLLSNLAGVLEELVKSGGLQDVLTFIDKFLEGSKKFGGTQSGQSVFHDLIILAAIGGPLLVVGNAALSIFNALSGISKLKGVSKVLDKLKDVSKTGGKGLLTKLGKGGVIGLAAGAAGAIAGGVVSDGRGGARDVAGGALSGAGTGAGIGATVGAFFGGVGAGPGAAIGAGIGAGVGAVKGNGGFSKTFDDVKRGVSKLFDDVNKIASDRGVDLGNLLKHPFEEFPNVVSAVVQSIPGLISGFFDRGSDLFDWVGDQAQKAAQKSVEFIGNIPILAIHLLTDIVKGIPNVFGWVLDQATNVIASVVNIFTNFVEHPVESIENLGDFLINVGAALFSGIDQLNDSSNGVGKKIIQGILDGIGNVSEEMAPALAELTAALYQSGQQISIEWNRLWDGLKQYVIDRFKDIVQSAANGGAQLYTQIYNVLTSVGTFWTNFWQGLKNWATLKISEATTGIFNTINGFRQNISDTLGNIGNTWNRFWDGLKAAAAEPVKFVINTVINGGIGNAWKTVDKFLNGILPDWNDVTFSGFDTGGVLPGYTPGRDVHMFSSPTAGNLALSGGEAIMRPEWTRAVGGERGVEAMNRAARTGGVTAVQSMLGGAFAGGGVLQRFANGGVAKVIDFGRWLRGQGYSVTENKALGSNPRQGAHSASGYHYRDDNSGAIDVNKGAGTSLAEQLELAKAVNSARTRGLRSYFFASDGSHEDHAHFDYGSGDNVQTSKMPKQVADILKSGSGSGGGFFSGLWDDAKGIASDTVSALANFAGNLPIVSTVRDMANSLGGLSTGDVSLKSAAVGAASSLVTSTKNYLADKVGAFFGSGESAESTVGGVTSYGAGTGSANAAESGSGVERWRSVALQALAITGSPTSWITSLLRRMNQESSGNPKAINLTDINAKRGTPSKGLLQLIDPTFKSWALPGYNKDVYDPLSNIIASIRYAEHFDGNATHRWDRKGGYRNGGVLGNIPSLADGGIVKPRTGGTLALLAEAGKAEAVVDAEKLSRLLDSANANPTGGVVFQPGAIQISNPVPETASKSISDRMRTFAAFGLFDQS